MAADARGPQPLPGAAAAAVPAALPPADERPPVVGITTYARNDEGRFTLPAAYVDAVRRAGGMAVLMPPGEARLAIWLATLDALILPGGGDVDATLFGGRGHATNYGVDPGRDRDEILLARAAVDHDLPTFAICRGAQVLNVAFGGTLIEHLPDVVGESVLHRDAQAKAVRHPVRIVPESKLWAVLGTDEVTPASMHHQAIERLAAGLVVVGHAPDGTIEAVERPGHCWLIGVQWHPELTAAEDPLQQRLFDSLVTAARVRRDARAAGAARAEREERGGS